METRLYPFKRNHKSFRNQKFIWGELIAPKKLMEKLFLVEFFEVLLLVPNLVWQKFEI